MFLGKLVFITGLFFAVIPCKECNQLIESLEDSELEDAILKQLEQDSGTIEEDDSSLGSASSLDKVILRHSLQGHTASSSSKESSHNGNCLALPSEIHVTKDELDESGNVVRTCEGSISVTKCEGTCRSELRPSVSSPSGLFKECYCCRESSMKFKIFSLNDCFTPDGVRINHPSNKAVMEIKMKEPDGCSCHTCGI